jgi:hypothetical protein
MRSAWQQGFYCTALISVSGCLVAGSVLAFGSLHVQAPKPINNRVRRCRFLLALPHRMPYFWHPPFPATFLSTTTVPLTSLLKELCTYRCAVPPDPETGAA